MKINQLKTFIAVVDSGSLAAAGAKIGLTTSAVSLQIRALEEEFGVSLFDRKQRPFRASAQGNSLANQARKILLEFDRIPDIVNNQRLSGLLRLGAVPTTIASILPEALCAIRDNHPGLQLSIRGSNSGVLANALLCDEIDAVLLTEPRQANPAFQWVEIAREPLIVIGPDNCKGRTDEEVLTQNPFIWFNRNTWAGQSIERHINDRNLFVDACMEIDSIEAIRAMVSAGLGVSIVPQSIGGAPFPDEIRVIPFGKPNIHRVIGVLSRTRSEKNEAITALVDALKVQVKKYST